MTEPKTVDELCEIIDRSVLDIQDLIAERDQLKARVAELEEEVLDYHTLTEKQEEFAQFSSKQILTYRDLCRQMAATLRAIAETRWDVRASEACLVTIQIDAGKALSAARDAGIEP